MKLSIIIVSWNTAELTLKCLKSIFLYLGDKLDYEIFLVDNNSSDNTLELAKELVVKYKNLYVITNKENLGFAKANNLAIKQAQGEYILLLNPDTELIDESLVEMIKFAESDEKIGIVGSKLLNFDKSLQRSCRKFPSLLDQVLIQLKFYNLWPEKFKSIHEYFMLDFDHNEIKEVDQVMGAVMLIKKEVFSALGGTASGGELFDEKFWAIFEEVDFCQRAKNMGYKIYFYPNTKIVHHKEQSFMQMASIHKQINFNRSLYYYFKKYKPFYQFLILWLLQPVNLFLTWIDSSVGIKKFLGKSKDL
jgi:GT2 family glycosyltransferase